MTGGGASAPARLGSRSAHGGGGCRPSPLLLAPRGANQRAQSWHAEQSRGAGDAERGREGTRARLGGGLWHLRGKHKRQRRQPAKVASWGGHGALGGVKDQGPLGAGFCPRPTLCPGLGVASLSSAVGVRLRPREEKNFGNKVGAESGGAQDACVIRRWKTWKSAPRTLGTFTAGQFSLGWPPACHQVCTLTLSVGVSRPTCSQVKGY